MENYVSLDSPEKVTKIMKDFLCFYLRFVLMLSGGLGLGWLCDMKTDIINIIITHLS